MSSERIFFITHVANPHAPTNALHSFISFNVVCIWQYCHFFRVSPLSDALLIMWNYTWILCLSCFCLQEDMYVMRKVWVRSCQQELWFCVLCRIANEEDIDSRINWVRCIHLLNVCTGCPQTALYGHLIEIIVDDFLLFVQDPKVLTLNTHPCLTITFLPCSSTITLWVFRSQWG